MLCLKRILIVLLCASGIAYAQPSLQDCLAEMQEEMRARRLYNQDLLGDMQDKSIPEEDRIASYYALYYCPESVEEPMLWLQAEVKQGMKYIVRGIQQDLLLYDMLLQAVSKALEAQDENSNAVFVLHSVLKVKQLFSARAYTKSESITQQTRKDLDDACAVLKRMGRREEERQYRRALSCCPQMNPEFHEGFYITNLLHRFDRVLAREDHFLTNILILHKNSIAATLDSYSPWVSLQKVFSQYQERVQTFKADCLMASSVPHDLERALLDAERKVDSSSFQKSEAWFLDSVSAYLKELYSLFPKDEEPFTIPMAKWEAVSLATQKFLVAFHALNETISCAHQEMDTQMNSLLKSFIPVQEKRGRRSRPQKKTRQKSIVTASVPAERSMSTSPVERNMSTSPANESQESEASSADVSVVIPEKASPVISGASSPSLDTEKPVYKEKEVRALPLVQSAADTNEWMEEILDSTSGQPDFRRCLKKFKKYLRAEMSGTQTIRLSFLSPISGQKVIFFFDSPHGAQLRKGRLAGWVKAMATALKSAGFQKKREVA